jgi:DNA polymerase III delta prime subunit
VQDAEACDKAPLRILFNGEPGIGKSTLAKYLIKLLDCDPKWSVKKYNGTSVKIETVEEIAVDLHYKDIFGAWRLIWIEEADMIPAVAQVRFLTLLDDLTYGCAVVCTSNCKLADFKKRFQTRFRVFEIEPPKPEEIQGLLKRFLNDPRAIINIATFACGNVRQALLDAESVLQAEGTTSARNLNSS